jgi:hypothetical protein
MARDQGLEDTWRRASEALRAGRLGVELEKDLDALDAMVARVQPGGLFSGSREYRPLPGGGPASGAAWWSCPLDLCAGRGRVLPRQKAPVCGIGRRSLTATPL